MRILHSVIAVGAEHGEGQRDGGEVARVYRIHAHATGQYVPSRPRAIRARPRLRYVHTYVRTYVRTYTPPNRTCLIYDVPRTRRDGSPAKLDLRARPHWP